MKNNFKILVLLTSGLMSSAFADTASLCSQSHTSFLEVAREYSACNSIVGSDQAACNKFCEDADKLNGSGVILPAQQYCSPDQINSIEKRARMEGIDQGRRQGRDEVIRDLSVKEDFISADYYGINESDCSNRVSQATQNLRIEAIRRCNEKATSIRNCYIQSEKNTGSFGRPPKFEGVGNFRRDDNRSNQDECQKAALAQATSMALKSCMDATGNECSVNTAETLLNHRLQAPSGPRFGRRDDRICDAKVVVEASKDLAYKCNAKISARNQVSAN
ncbi:MAG: hypothetical protein Q7U04_02045 [Bacteriovorax sp.]|nr:hypothetical protein [Bacteriovorax sp.]